VWSQQLICTARTSPDCHQIVYNCPYDWPVFLALDHVNDHLLKCSHYWLPFAHNCDLLRLTRFCCFRLEAPHCTLVYEVPVSVTSLSSLQLSALISFQTGQQFESPIYAMLCFVRSVEPFNPDSWIADTPLLWTHATKPNDFLLYDRYVVHLQPLKWGHLNNQDSPFWSQGTQNRGAPIYIPSSTAYQCTMITLQAGSRGFTDLNSLTLLDPIWRLRKLAACFSHLKEIEALASIGSFGILSCRNCSF
jgi:hypothetical protein